jgi:short-subunit dehydrogenase
MATSPRSLLITGASSGIGEALARRYAAPGVALALIGRDGGRLAKVVAACRTKRATVESAVLDVTEREAMGQWIERLDARQPLDLVIANAGVSAGAGRTRESEAAVRQVFAVNIDGVLNTVLPILPRFVARRRGQIALMSSLAAFRGLPTAPAYSASKAAVKALGEAWRVQLAGDGIRVSVICPGFVATRMTEKNKFRMPLLMTAERAAQIIERGLARDQGRIAFPWATAAGSWFLGAVPARLGDWLVRRFARAG